MAAAVSPRPAGRQVLDVRVRRHVVDAELRLPLDGPPVTVLFGPSGSGKTTVLRALAGLDRGTGTRVVLAGEVWDDGSRRFVPPRRRRVGYLFQDHALFPHLDVDGNVAFGLQRLPRAERADRVRAALEAVGASHLAGRPVTGLSGGEGQRVALARALAPQPRLLLLDEPLSALDTPTRTRLRTELRRILLRQGVPTVLVTHDRAEALALADRVVVLVGGRVRQLGTATEVFDRPRDPDVARAVGVETAVPGRVVAADGALLRVAVGPVTVTALLTDEPDASLGPGDDVTVCIRAEDVALALPGPGGPSSPRNHLRGTVGGVSIEGALVRVDLDVGFGLTAYITRPALDELGLRPGVAVTAAVKSPAVHLIPVSA
ncbi:MAG: ABC transporter ATP-binding protein [Actinomycetia bacterium]|nr:ABC transporter ATP-binding protein [Actinomycetes bacterium]